MPEAPTYRNALPLNTMLLEYRLESVLGTGGFGLTYLGWDTNLEKHVAIKEYLPGELAIRALDGSIVPVNTENEYNYKWGLDRFIQEARTLAKFSHPNIVHVNRFFEANSTSYMVMDYEAGESLHQHLQRMPMPDEATLKKILMPILDGLQAVHKIGFLHRDIKPSNVFMRENGVPVLIDFGSARMATGRISKSLTAIVSPGYAPLEQYSNDGHQGPWTDIYALSGVMYRAVTGENPPDAIKRVKSDSVAEMLFAERARFSERFLKAIEWGMMLNEKMRPQNIADWRDLFLGRAPMTALSRNASLNTPRLPTTVAAGESSSRVRSQAGRRSTNGKPELASHRKWLVASGMLLIMLALGLMVWQHQRTTTAAREKQAGTPLPATALPSPQAVPQDQTVLQNQAPREPDPQVAAQPQPAVPKAETFVRLTPPPAAPAAPGQSSANTPPDLRPEIRRKLADTAAIAGTEERRDAQLPLPLRKEFEAADRDGDGYLTHSEIRGKFPFIEQNFSQVDTDGDGRISPAELMQLRKKQQGKKFER